MNNIDVTARLLQNKLKKYENDNILIMFGNGSPIHNVCIRINKHSDVFNLRNELSTFLEHDGVMRCEVSFNDGIPPDDLSKSIKTFVEAMKSAKYSGFGNS